MPYTMTDEDHIVVAVTEAGVRIAHFVGTADDARAMAADLFGSVETLLILRDWDDIPPELFANPPG